MSWNPAYPAEPTNPPVAFDGPDFDVAVRRSFQGMGRVDTTPFSIPWSAIDVPVVDALPVKPNDRAEVNYLADAANGVLWRLVYLHSTGKWHHIGGPPLRAEKTDTDDVFTTATWVDGNPVGPALVAPFAGVYRVHFGSRMQHSIATGFGYAGVSVEGAAPSDALLLFQSAAANVHDMKSWTEHLTTTAASGTFKLMYTNTSGSGNFSLQPGTSAPTFIEITPIAVSA